MIIFPNLSSLYLIPLEPADSSTKIPPPEREGSLSSALEVDLALLWKLSWSYVTFFIIGENTKGDLALALNRMKPKPLPVPDGSGLLTARCNLALRSSAKGRPLMNWSIKGTLTDIYY